MKKIYEDLLDDIEAKSSHSDSLSDDEYVLDFDDATRWTHLILMEYPIDKPTVEIVRKSVDNITHILESTKGVSSHSDVVYTTDDDALLAQNIPFICHFNFNEYYNPEKFNNFIAFGINHSFKNVRELFRFITKLDHVLPYKQIEGENDRIKDYQFMEIIQSNGEAWMCLHDDMDTLTTDVTINGQDVRYFVDEARRPREFRHNQSLRNYLEEAYRVAQVFFEADSRKIVSDLMKYFGEAVDDVMWGRVIGMFVLNLMGADFWNILNDATQNQTTMNLYEFAKIISSRYHSSKFHTYDIPRAYKNKDITFDLNERIVSKYIGEEPIAFNHLFSTHQKNNMLKIFFYCGINMKNSNHAPRVFLLEHIIEIPTGLSWQKKNEQVLAQVNALNVLFNNCMSKETIGKLCQELYKECCAEYDNSK